MNYNNFFMHVLFNVIILCGINAELRGMESATIVVVGTVVGVLVVKNSAVYKTYAQHNARQIEEKEKSDNPLLYAQPLSAIDFEQKEISGNEKLVAFLKKNDEERNAYNQQAKKNELYWKKAEFIDSYQSTTQ